MSWATCYSGSNNIHFKLPALMSDKRMFTSYEPSCRHNKEFRNSLGISNNYTYRQWLIKNGTNVMERNNSIACHECSECVKSAANAPKTQKYLFQGCGDASMPYGYETSDLKNIYLSRQNLNSQLQAPILTQEQLLLSRASKCTMGTADGAGPMKSCSSNRFM